MIPRFLTVIAAVLCVLRVQAQELVTLSTAVSPRVAYQAERIGERLVVTVEAEAFGKEKVSIELGIAGEKTVILSPEEAKVSRIDGGLRWRFELPANRLVRNDAGWKQLRLAFAVEWQGGPGGVARQRERFLHAGAGAAHGGLSKDPREWAALDLEKLAREAADRALQIRLAVDLAMSGKGSVVIEDPAGRRVRNLVSGAAVEKGSE